MTKEEIRAEKIAFFNNYCNLKGWVKGKLTMKQFIEMRNQYIIETCNLTMHL